MDRLSFKLIFQIGFCLLLLYSQKDLNLRNSTPIKFPFKENLLIKRVRGIETDNNNRLYLLNPKYGNVIVLDLNTGSLIKTISSKGQGPYELGEPRSFKIKNDKLYIADDLYGGVKIFSTEGEFVRSFKVNRLSSYCWRIDVDDLGNIYVPYFNFNEKKSVLILNESGEVKKAIITNPFMNADKSLEMFKNLIFDFAIDPNLDIIIVYPLQRKIKKYNNNGFLQWEKVIPIENIPKNWPKEITVSPDGSVSRSPLIGKIYLNNRGDMIVSTIDRLIRFNGNGQIISNIFGLDLGYEIKWHNEKIIAYSVFGEGIEIFKFKEEK